MINEHETEYVGEEEQGPEPGSQIALVIMKSQPRDRACSTSLQSQALQLKHLALKGFLWTLTCFPLNV